MSEEMTPTHEEMTPTHEAALVALIREAAERGHAVATEGGGTKRHFGPAAPAHARRVSLRGLARVTAHEPADLILSVEAGARLRDVQAQLAAHDQWLPLDPPFADATIGGVLATNASGPRRLGYGTSRDLLLGVRVVGATGQVTKSGGRVVKNVSGYDLHRPQVGAFGTLGVIVEAHLKVSARPETSALWLLPCPTLDAAHRLLLEVGATALRPVALEALDASDASSVRARWPGLPGTSSQAVALVGIEGTRASFERHARDLAPYAVRAEGARVVIVERPDVDALWAALADLPAAHAGDVRVRIGARPHELPALLAELEPARAAVRGVRVGAGVGVAHLSLASDDGAPALAEIVARWQRLAAPRGGYAVVESAPADLPARATLPFGTREGAGEGLDAALRRAWDPRGTLNPGRMAS
jgi:glycolate oxidase FAD binding subunit